MGERVKEYFATWDPMDFIKDDGAPVEEYNGEAMALQEWFQRHEDASAHQVAEYTYKMFVERMDIDPVGFREACFQRAVEILAVLHEDLSR
jgi:hypothetical protein